MKRAASILIMLILLSASLSLAEESVILQKGSKGDEVLGLQQRLITLGYLDGSADGMFGAKTQTAVEAFQRAHALTVTGVAGAAELDALSEVFRGYAARAAMVAMTNALATDVFAADGSTYDPAKFHSYANESGFHMTLEAEGTWTADARDAWRVEDIRFAMAGQETGMRASMSVRFDGISYVISHVTRTIGKPEDLDSGDASKLSVEQLEPSGATPFLTVPYSLVKQDRASEIQAKQEAEAEAAADAKQRWLDSQFSQSDGSHKALETLILGKLKSPETYEHIETTWVEIDSEGTMMKINLVLQGSKFDQRVKLGDLFIDTQFRALNSDGALAVGTAYAIARFDDNSLSLLGIVGL